VRIRPHGEFVSGSLRRNKPGNVRVRIDDDPVAWKLHRLKAGRNQAHGRRCRPVKRKEEQQRQKYNEAHISQGERFSMKRKAYGRDAGLSARMALTTFTLGLLYVAFAAVLIWLLGGNLI